MMKGGGAGQNLPADVSQLIDQLERHCLAPDDSLVSKSSFFDLRHAREEMSRERLRYLEALAIYSEAVAMVEEHHPIREIPLFPRYSLKTSDQVCDILEHRLVVAEAAQKLRFPLISKDGDIHEDDVEIWTDSAEPGVGGVPNRFFGLTRAYLWQTQLQQMPLSMDMADYQMALSHEIEARLTEKCDKLADAFVDDIDSSPSQVSTTMLRESVKLMIDEIEREEAALREDLFSADRKFSEYYNVLEQILFVLIKLVKDLKLQHQHKYDELQKTWLSKRCETMSAKLRVLEHALLLETYTQESIPALHKIRKYLVEATEEASMAYNKAVTRLREYQGVDPHFDTIARQYQDTVMKLQHMQWTINQVEMDFEKLPDHSNP